MENTNKGGRPQVADQHKKRNRTITATDKEWLHLEQKAHKAGQTKSEYIIKSLNL